MDFLSTINGNEFDPQTCSRFLNLVHLILIFNGEQTNFKIIKL